MLGIKNLERSVIFKISLVFGILCMICTAPIAFAADDAAGYGSDNNDGSTENR